MSQKGLFKLIERDVRFRTTGWQALMTEMKAQSRRRRQHIQATPARRSARKMADLLTPSSLANSPNEAPSDLR